MTEELDVLSPKGKAQFWEGHIQAWRESGLSQSEYCRRNELIRHRFWYWRRRIQQAGKESISFVPVALRSSPVAPALPLTSVSVTTPNGYRIELESGFDPDLIGRLMHSIREL